MKRRLALSIVFVLIFCMGLGVLTGCNNGGQDVDAAVEAATSKLNAKIAALYEQINEANEKVTALEAEKAALVAEKSALESEITKKDESIAALEARVAELTALLDGEDAELVGKLEALEAEKATLTSEKEALTVQVTALEASISEKDGQITALNTELSGLKEENAALKVEIENLKANGDAALKSEIAALKNCVKGEHTLSAAKNNNDGSHVYTCTTCATTVSEKHTFSSDVCTACGAKQHGYGDYEYVYFGEYPQSVKSDDVTITETQDERGYYLGSDGYYYAKLTALPAGMITFNNGEYITNNAVYYFKVEPIRWRVLSDANGEKLLLCDSIIEKKQYQSSGYRVGSFSYTKANGAPEGTYANNYEYSGIRAWLNGDFYSNYFTAEEQAKIMLFQIDNSAASTGYENNPYYCNDTEDNIFLLSYAEATNTDYGFTANAARYMVTSDYARASGVSISTSQSTYGNGSWWLRSPYNDDSPSALGILSDGRVYISGGVSYDGTGVVPALRIRQ